MNQEKISIVVAVYNESVYNLRTLIKQLATVLCHQKTSYEVIFVDDGSQEATNACLHELCQQLDYIKLVKFSRNFGQQAAISAGINFASGEAIITMDSDLQDPPELIPEMLQLWRSGFDVVYAKRSTRKDRLLKKWSASIFYKAMSLLSSINIPEDAGEFRLIDHRVAETLKQLPERTRYLRGLIPWLGFRQTAITINRNARQHGESGYTLKKLIALAFDGILSFSSLPLYAALVLGTVLMLCSMLIPLLAIILFKQHHLWPACIASAVLFLFALQCQAIGIVGLYIAKILDEVRSRPLYIVSELAGRGFERSNKEKNIIEGMSRQFKELKADTTTDLL